ncbi:MAG: lysophospholipid acyltransferase family protein [Verrucomicrobiales bacterium]|nr:lysophospholipid acyltransferase family protein [Verrucomicrobiales bacterium]
MYRHLAWLGRRFQPSFIEMPFSKKLRYKLEFIALYTLTKVIPALPEGVAHSLGVTLGKLAYRFDKRGRATALENLTLIFGKEKSKIEIECIAQMSYRSFAKTVIDQLRSPKITADNYLEFVDLVMEDPQAMEDAAEAGAIWVTPHYSNFEWIALIMGFRGCSFTIVAQDFKNESLTEMYKANREVSGHNVIPQKNALFALLRSLKRGGHAAFLTDLAVKPSKTAAVIECFGKKVSVTAIHAELQKRTGLPVIPGICIPLEDGRYEMHGFKPLIFGPDDSSDTIAQACWDVFEPIIRENPAPWLWMYKHFRFLPSAEEKDNYPSYARPNLRFEEMVARQEEGKLKKT